MPTILERRFRIKEENDVPGKIIFPDTDRKTQVAT
jgi:hypothetical protein